MEILYNKYNGMSGAFSNDAFPSASKKYPDTIFVNRSRLTSAFCHHTSRTTAITTDDLYLQIIPELERQGQAQLALKKGKFEVYAFRVSDLDDDTPPSGPGPNAPSSTPPDPNTASKTPPETQQGPCSDPSKFNISTNSTPRLTQLGEGTEDTRRRATTTELITDPCEGDAVEIVVRTMADARLLTVGTDEQNGERLVDVSHEALIRGWPRLRKWIDESRAALRVHRRVTEAAQEWQRLNQDPGALFRGARLAQAQEWRDHHNAILNELEREFLDASIAERRELQRQQRQRQRLLVGALLAFAILAVGASAAAFFGFWQKGEAEKAATLARNAEDSAQKAQNRISEGASQAYASLATTSEALGAPMRHKNALYDVEFSSDGKRVVTASADHTARLWDATTGQPIGTPLEHEDSVVSAKFSPDGQRVVTASDDGTARLWDAATGQPIGTPLRHQSSVYSVQFSPDGQRVVTVSRNNTARLWDVPTLSNEDSREDVLLLADLAEASGGVSLESSGQTQIFKVLSPEHVRAITKRIAIRFTGALSQMSSLQRLMFPSGLGVGEERSRN